MREAIPPRITVVIPNRGRPDLCPASIQSLKRQSLSAWEAIVVDDGSSTQDLTQIQQAIGDDPRVRMVRRDRPPAGANHCRNLGVQHAHADLIMFLDSDDMLSPNCLAARVDAMQRNPDLAFIVFGHERFKEQPGDLNDPWPVRSDEDHLRRFLIMVPPWQTAGPTWRRSALEAVGAWDEGLSCGQDWDYHVRALALELPYAIVQEPRFFHRLTGSHRDSISSWKVSSHEVVRARERMLPKAFEILRRRELLNPERELLFARLFLLTAEMAVQLGENAGAQRLWKCALELELISPRQYREGKILFRVHRISILRRAFRLYTRLVWPPLLRHQVTSTSLAEVQTKGSDLQEFGAARLERQRDALTKGNPSGQ